MTFRFRPALTPLESRENPSVPGIDPFGGAAPAPVDPTPPPTTTDPVILQTAIDAVIAGAGSAPTTPTTAGNILLENNSIYKIPIVQ